MPLILNSKTINKKTSIQTGNDYESLAETYLKKNGLNSIDRNFHSRFGEIDLIMMDQTTLVFTEVRFRKNADFGGALSSVTRNKQLKIVRTAEFFISKNRNYHSHNCRFDVVGIEKDKENNLQFNWIKNAFME